MNKDIGMEIAADIGDRQISGPNADEEQQEDGDGPSSFTTIEPTPKRPSPMRGAAV